MTDDLVKRLRELGSKQHADPSTAPEFVFLDPDLPPSEWEKQYSMDVVYVRADRIEALTAEVGELQEVFDFQWRANMRAVEMWRTANPGNDLVLPDSAKLTVWLLERIEELEWLRDALVKKVQGLTNLLDNQFGTPCEQIRHKQEIEALTEQLEAARADAKEAEAYADELAEDQVDLCRQLIAAEDKLAQAVEGLREIAGECGCSTARATLAEIKGEET
jgi:hypothetical protein